MSEASQCPHCGKPLPKGALAGLCPDCMLAAGLPTESGAPGEASAKLTPTVEEIARHFPQLEVLECLGRGGMGVLYRARQPQLNRMVALKILAPEKEHDPAFGERFTREAQALARLNHPNIVTVYDFGRADGLYFLLMEFVEGLNLRQLLRSGRIKPEEALSIVPKICEALQFAHEHGIVHRDIKPENILLDKHGRVKIADFGIAKLVGSDPAHTLTEHQHTIGTPHYMAPEQVEHPETVDHRADIYSLGVVFYEMLTGELPLGKFERPSSKVQLDVRLDEVVLRTLEKEPERRYQQAGAVKTDVETIAASPAPSRAPASAGRPQAFTPRFWARLAFALFLAGTLGTLLLLSITPRHDYVLIFAGAALITAFGATLISWRDRITPALVLKTLLVLLASGAAVAIIFTTIRTGRIRAQHTATEQAAIEAEQLQALWKKQASREQAEHGRDLETVPPVVVETVPAAGSSDVDPGLTEIAVTFSKPMLDGSWSWVQLGPETFPKMTGDPRYGEDGRKCVLPVQLQPGKTYAIWLNVDNFQNFRDRDQRPAVPYLLIFETRKKP